MKAVPLVITIAVVWLLFYFLGNFTAYVLPLKITKVIMNSDDKCKGDKP